jgi:hypothetical protein
MGIEDKLQHGEARHFQLPRPYLLCREKEHATDTAIAHFGSLSHPDPCGIFSLFNDAMNCVTIDG